MKSSTPQTLAERQAVLDDALAAMVDGDGAHNRRVLAEALAILRQDAPRLWEKIEHCPACGGSYVGCAHCKADRLDYAALIGM